jgi:hypothetical protein
MNNFLEQPFVKFIRILLASLVVSFVIFIFLTDAFKSIWAGCFILVFYYMHEGFDDIKKGSNEEDKSFLFTNKFTGIMTFSIIILIATTLLAGIIYTYSVHDQICIKGSFFYSEKQCAIQSVDEKYSPDYNSDDNNF